MPRLVITKGAGAGRDHAIGMECVVGRAPGADFIVDDNLVSRRHARIYREGDGYVVEDLGSRNGTLVNGKRMPRARIADGDTIGVGHTEIAFRQKTLEQAAAGGKPLGAAPRPPVAPVPPTVPVKPFAKPAPSPEAAPAPAPVPPALSTSVGSSTPSEPAADSPPPPKPPEGPGPRKRRLIS